MERSMGSTVAAPEQLSTRPLLGGFGVEIARIDVKTADPDALQGVASALAHHGAIVLRGQSLSPREQVEFTSLFGDPAGNPQLEFTVPDEPKVFVISNKVVNGKPIGDPEAGTAWHTDLNYERRPAAYTCLHALEVPPEGSDTLIADTCAAWNALPQERRQQIEGLKVHHSYANLAARSNRILTDEERREYPDVLHPLVRRHPADGRKALWGLSTTTPNGIVDMPNPGGKDLIRELMEFATQDKFVYRHKWQVGDILVWDNRCTLHRGTPFDKGKYSRLVHRTWVRGEEPV
jgi:taurine dioxygenase